MRLDRAIKDKLMDVRLQDKNIFDSKLTKEECAKHISELSDDSDNMTTTDEVRNAALAASQEG